MLLLKVEKLLKLVLGVDVCCLIVDHVSVLRHGFKSHVINEMDKLIRLSQKPEMTACVSLLWNLSPFSGRYAIDLGGSEELDIVDKINDKPNGAHFYSSPPEKQSFIAPNRTLTLLNSLVFADASEPVIVRDVLYDWLGIPTENLERPSNDPFATAVIIPSLHVAPHIRTSVRNLTKLGAHRRGLQHLIKKREDEYAEASNRKHTPFVGLISGEEKHQTKGSCGLIGKALLEEVKTWLTRADRLVHSLLDVHLSRLVSTQTDGTAAGASKVSEGELSLHNLWVWVQSPLSLMRLLLFVMSETENFESSVSILNFLNSYPSTGWTRVVDYVATDNVIASLLESAAAPLLSMAASWIGFGELNDPYDEFFIRLKSPLPISNDPSKNDVYDSYGIDVQNSKIEGTTSPSWSELGVVDVSRLPHFISVDLARRVLLVGRSIRFMASKSCEEPATDNPRDALLIHNKNTLPGPILADFEQHGKYIPARNVVNLPNVPNIRPGIMNPPPRQVFQVGSVAGGVHDSQLKAAPSSSRAPSMLGRKFDSLSIAAVPVSGGVRSGDGPHFAAGKVAVSRVGSKLSRVQNVEEHLKRTAQKGSRRRQISSSILEDVATSVISHTMNKKKGNVLVGMAGSIAGGAGSLLNRRRASSIAASSIAAPVNGHEGGLRRESSAASLHPPYASDSILDPSSPRGSDLEEGWNSEDEWLEGEFEALEEVLGTKRRGGETCMQHVVRTTQATISMQARTGRLAMRRVVASLLGPADILGHCEAVRNFVLLANGMFAQRLLELATPELDRRAADVYLHVLRGVLKGALIKTHTACNMGRSNWEEGPVSNLDVSLMQASPQDTGWEIFTLVYKPPSEAVRAVLHPQALEAYERVFSVMWRLVRTEAKLTAAWHLHLQASRHMRRPLPELRSLCATSSSMLHVVQVVHSYIAQQSFHESWTDFCTMACRCSDLSQLISLHDDYLLAILEGSFLLTPFHNNNGRSKLNIPTEPPVVLAELFTLLDIALRHSEAQQQILSGVLARAEAVSLEKRGMVITPDQELLLHDSPEDLLLYELEGETYVESKSLQWEFMEALGRLLLALEGGEGEYDEALTLLMGAYDLYLMQQGQYENEQEPSPGEDGTFLG